MQRKLYMFGVFLMFLICLCGCGGRGSVTLERTSDQSDGAAEAVSDAEESGEDASEVPGTDTGSGSEAESAQTTDSVFVYVCGAVVNPGVYELPFGSRVYEAVKMAGGFTQDAAEECVNQADLLADAQMIRIYTNEEYEELKASGEADISDVSATEGASSDTAQESAGISSDGKVNLNTATLEELMTLSGIGETKAQAIISYREEHGSFGSIEEIMNVSGIKDGIYAAIKDDITVQ